ncbi:MAG: hypothetical protein ACREQE_05150 [Candidatus Binataceae bacterium]
MRDGKDFQKEGMSDRTRNIIVLCVVILIGIVCYFGVTWDHAFNTSDEASTFAQAVIHNSPVVEQHIGWVTSIKQTAERYTSGSKPQVLLDFDVTGRKGNGKVSLTLERINNNIWSMPEANMTVGTEKIGLRGAPPTKAPSPMAMF